MSVWKKKDIAHKWTPVKITGPNVTVDQALEYIWFTDNSLREPTYAGNDSQFRIDLQKWLGYPPDHDDWKTYWLNCEKYVKNHGFIHLEHLSSNWICSAFIFGPHGPVHPDGAIGFDKNFGKWPSIEEIELDLDIVSKKFPWLELHIGLWDSSDETSVGEADFAWVLKDGVWKRESPFKVFKEYPPTSSVTFEKRISDLMGYGYSYHNERTWEVSELDSVFGKFKKG